MESINLSNSLTAIEDHTFDKCSGLYNIIIPSSIKSIGKFAFTDCKNLSSAIIPDQVTIIDYCAFCGCKALSFIKIGKSVSTIGENAFDGNNTLNTVIIGENVTAIGKYAFRNCSSLENLVAMRERPIIINSNVFDGVPKASCDLHVRQGSKIRYENQDVWKDFLIILEDAEDWADVGGGSTTTLKGDVNGDGHVNSADVTAIYDILLGSE